MKQNREWSFFNIKLDICMHREIINIYTANDQTGTKPEKSCFFYSQKIFSSVSKNMIYGIKCYTEIEQNKKEDTTLIRDK